MANITTYLEKKLLAHSVGQSTFSPPTGVYAGLFISTPTIDYTSSVPTGVEVGSTDHGYSRKAITWNAATTTTTSGVTVGSISNSADITWTATGYWNSATGATSTAPIRSVGVFDASTGGNLLWFGPLNAAVTMQNGDTFSINANNFILTLS
jgi:hypothetical protein